VSCDGVYPLAPSLDTIGPMARTISGLITGMQLLEPGFAVAPNPATTIGRVRTTGDPRIEAAVDRALQEAGFAVVDIDFGPLAAGTDLFTAIYFSEVAAIDGPLVREHPDGVGEDIKSMLELAPAFATDMTAVQQQLETWRKTVAKLFDQVELLALPTLPVFPPRLDELTAENLVEKIIEITAHVSLFNAAGNPCTAQPVPAQGSSLPASLQLVGPLGGEQLLLPTALVVEAAVGSG
jgi:amidase